ncbi:hypothetical protein HGRIS_011100 [Hohenbuehelia grisea]|uniref:Uncharacterized protein n=1 Tax=Hohenbuehelia grisea TaxID=104357 RepID=A0ABR3IZB4_9AGAR
MYLISRPSAMLIWKRNVFFFRYVMFLTHLDLPSCDQLQNPPNPCDPVILFLTINGFCFRDPVHGRLKTLILPYSTLFLQIAPTPPTLLCANVGLDFPTTLHHAEPREHLNLLPPTLL